MHASDRSVFIAFSRDFEHMLRSLTLTTKFNQALESVWRMEQNCIAAGTEHITKGLQLNYGPGYYLPSKISLC